MNNKIAYGAVIQCNKIHLALTLRELQLTYVRFTTNLTQNWRRVAQIMWEAFPDH